VQYEIWTFLWGLPYLGCIAALAHHSPFRTRTHVVGSLIFVPTNMGTLYTIFSSYTHMSNCNIIHRTLVAHCIVFSEFQPTQIVLEHQGPFQSVNYEQEGWTKAVVSPPGIISLHQYTTPPHAQRMGRKKTPKLPLNLTFYHVFFL